MKMIDHLDLIQIRVPASRGKEQVTPEYCLSTVNPLRATCNKNNTRDSVTGLTETEVVPSLGT